jgi:DNA repair exonuclease SbcCD ATPase subunit
LYHPATPTAPAAGPHLLAVGPEQKADLERKLRQLEKKPRPPRPGEKPRSEELKRLEAEMDKLAQKPPQTRDQARDMVKDLTEVQDRVQKREKELAERAAALKEQMRQLDRLTGKKPADGPAQRLQKALDQAAFKKAKEEAEKLGRQMEASEQANRLRKRLKQPELSEQDKREAREQLQRLKDQELSPEQRQQLDKQMQNIEEKIERLTRSEEARERLRQLERQGLLNKDQLERELDQLAQNDAKLDPQTRELLRQVAQKLCEARKAMGEGKDAEAAQKLREAAELLNKLDGDGECKELAQQVAALEAARQALCQALEGKPRNAPGGPGGPASGRRPESKDGKTGAKEEWAHSDLDKGQMQVIDHVPGEGFKGPRQPAEMAEDIRRAAQEAPEAIDRQRLPKSASDMAKGYFEKLRGGK